MPLTCPDCERAGTECTCACAITPHYFLYSTIYEARISAYVVDTAIIKEWSERERSNDASTIVCVTFNVEEDYLPLMEEDYRPLFVEEEF